MSNLFQTGVIFNLYPDSIDGNLQGLVRLLKRDEFSGVFSSVYLLPSIFQSDLDRGFSIVSYDLNRELVDKKDLEELKCLGLDLMLDIVLNHLSINSAMFQDIIENGEQSKYVDFFINWNKFWQGNGIMQDEGYILPNSSLIKDMFFRKPGLPILMITTKEGKKIPYWNTFYQEILPNGKYLGQMDLNIKNEDVWLYYQEVLQTLKNYGAKYIRLDAFAYASKEVGKKNFLNIETWNILDRLQSLANKNNLKLLPEIHASYQEGIYQLLSQKGYMTYDFFLPGLLIHAIEKNNPTKLKKWIDELIDNNIKTVNMLGCHDGIPLLDLSCLITKEEIDDLIKIIVNRGGLVKNLHGQTNVYYQVNATYYSALAKSDKKLLLARAIQMFMPGTPQVWYLDLFGGKNDIQAVKEAGPNGHKEINRTNLTYKFIEEALRSDLVKQQLKLLKLRNSHSVFKNALEIKVKQKNHILEIIWLNDKESLKLEANFITYDFQIS